MILIALGANLPSVHGAPDVTLRKAYDAIEACGVCVLARSDIWISAPVPASDQPWYHNAVAQVETGLSARALMARLHDIEVEFGRVRIAGVRNEARVLDLDLLAYDEEMSRDGLLLPHPRMHERAFVLYPLCDIAPNWLHPSLGRTAAQLMADLPADQDIKPLSGRAA